MATMQNAIQKGQPVPQLPFNASLSAQKQSRQSLGLNSSTANSTSNPHPPKFITAIKSDQQVPSLLITQKEEDQATLGTPIKNINPIQKELPLTITSLDKKQGNRPSTREVAEGI